MDPSKKDLPGVQVVLSGVRVFVSQSQYAESWLRQVECLANESVSSELGEALWKDLDRKLKSQGVATEFEAVRVAPKLANFLYQNVSPILRQLAVMSLLSLARCGPSAHDADVLKLLIPIVGGVGFTYIDSRRVRGIVSETIGLLLKHLEAAGGVFNCVHCLRTADLEQLCFALVQGLSENSAHARGLAMELLHQCLYCLPLTTSLFPQAGGLGPLVACTLRPPPLSTMALHALRILVEQAPKKLGIAKQLVMNNTNRQALFQLADSLIADTRPAAGAAGAEAPPPAASEPASNPAQPISEGTKRSTEVALLWASVCSIKDLPAACHRALLVELGHRPVGWGAAVLDAMQHLLCALHNMLAPPPPPCDAPPPTLSAQDSPLQVAALHESLRMVLRPKHLPFSRVPSLGARSRERSSSASCTSTPTALEPAQSTELESPASRARSSSASSAHKPSTPRAWRSGSLLSAPPVTARGGAGGTSSSPGSEGGAPEAPQDPVVGLVTKFSAQDGEVVVEMEAGAGLGAAVTQARAWAGRCLRGLVKELVIMPAREARTRRATLQPLRTLLQALGAALAALHHYCTLLGPRTIRKEVVLHLGTTTITHANIEQLVAGIAARFSLLLRQVATLRVAAVHAFAAAVVHSEARQAASGAFLRWCAYSHCAHRAAAHRWQADLLRERMILHRALQGMVRNVARLRRLRRLRQQAARLRKRWLVGQHWRTWRVAVFNRVRQRSVIGLLQGEVPAWDSTIRTLADLEAPDLQGEPQGEAGERRVDSEYAQLAAHQWRLLTTTLMAAWHSVCMLRRQQKQVLMLAAVGRRRWMGVRAVRSWSLVKEAGKATRILQRKADKLRRRHLRLAAVAGWRRGLEHQRLRAAAAAAATLHRMRKLRAHTLAAFRDHVARARCQRELSERAREAKEGARLQHCWSGWRALLHARAQEDATVEAHRKHQAWAQLRHILAVWQQRAKWRADKGRVRAHFSQQLALRAMAAWQAAWGHRRERRAQVAHAAAHRHHLLLSSAVEAWRRRMAMRGHQRAQWDRASAHMRCCQLAHAWRVWQAWLLDQWVHGCQVAVVEALHVPRMKLAAMDRWRAGIRAQRVRRQQTRAARAQRQCQLQQQVLRRWQWRVQERSQREKVEQCTKSLHTLTLQASDSAWHDLLRLAGLKRTKRHIAEEYAKRVAEGRVLRALQWARHWGCQRVMVAGEHARRTCLSAVFTAWVRLTVRFLHRREQLFRQTTPHLHSKLKQKHLLQLYTSPPRY